jgi:hypothetical protein
MRQTLNENLYDAAIQAFIDKGVPLELARPAAEVIATDAVGGSLDNPTERSPEQQQAVRDVWNWLHQEESDRLRHEFDFEEEVGTEESYLFLELDDQ